MTSESKLDHPGGRPSLQRPWEPTDPEARREGGDVPRYLGRDCEYSEYPHPRAKITPAGRAPCELGRELHDQARLMAAIQVGRGPRRRAAAAGRSDSGGLRSIYELRRVCG